MDRLSQLRAEIDRTDAELLALFVRRMELCTAVGEYKKERSLAIFDPLREAEIIERRAFEAGAWRCEAAELWKTMMRLSRKAQEAVLLTDDKER